MKVKEIKKIYSKCTLCSYIALTMLVAFNTSLLLFYSKKCVIVFITIFRLCYTRLFQLTLVNYYTQVI